MQKLQEIISNPIYYILLTVLLGIIQAIPDEIIKAKPVTWIGKKIGNFFNGCDIQKELKDIRLDIKEVKDEADLTNIETVKNRILAIDMMLRSKQDVSLCQYKAVFKDIDKWIYYHLKYPNLNGELDNAIAYIYKSYNNLK